MNGFAITLALTVMLWVFVLFCAPGKNDLTQLAWYLHTIILTLIIWAIYGVVAFIQWVWS